MYHSYDKIPTELIGPLSRFYWEARREGTEAVIRADKEKLEKEREEGYKTGLAVAVRKSKYDYWFLVIGFALGYGACYVC